jgi:signal peptidase II
MNKENKKNLWIFLAPIIIIIADILTKHFSWRFSFCNIFFCSKQVINKGAAFGLLQGYNWLFMTIGIVVIYLVIYSYKKTGSILLRFSFALIFAGTLSNLLDRLIYGYVQDWLAFGFWPSFPSFNIADASNTVGVLILVLSLIRNRKEHELS